MKGRWSISKIKLLITFLMVLVLVTSACESTKKMILIETTRTVLDKYQKDESYYLVLTNKSGKGESCTISLEDWLEIEKDKQYTFIVEKGDIKRLKK
ncbi:hypothetical protein WMW72_21245 [Paenibacillus filicis]|uniref:Uncharacterized protein n=1 Tax=Paenibacillus filicis TaxID=669464 RepID=A0ABU9DRQ0_9BACL